MAASFVSTYFLPAVLIIIMFGIGLSLERQDFVNVFRFPKTIFIGLFAQMILLPLVAFIILSITNLPPEIKVGFIIIAACPGGSASNLLNHLLKGNVALCVSLTAMNSILIQITMPLIVNLGLLVYMGQEADIHLPIWETIFKVFFVTLLPTFAGVYVRTRNLKLALKLENPLKVFMTVLLFSVFAAIILLEEKEGGAGIFRYSYLLPYALALNLGSMMAGYFFARSLGLDNRNNFTISIEVGLQNSALAIFVASTLLNNREMAIVAVVYSSFTFFTTALFGYLTKKFG
ncbi:MAG: bile acid:sodium symporter family protein [Bacteroidales bacterium]